MRIIHISDTHLGKRPKRTRASIINQEIKPIEDDFYNSWRRFIEEIINLNKDEKPDIIMHSGDFFDTPSGTDPSPPPEFARKVAAEAFKKLYENNIPIVIIDGNHGRYMQYRISPLTEYTILFDNVYLFTYFDIRDSIRNQQPLFKDFPTLNLRIHAHPSLESNDLPQLLLKYEDWVYIQNNNINPSMINVFLAHGMIENHTLNSNFLMGDYDYIGLGDNHKMQQINDNGWYAGSTELWSFNEETYQKEAGKFNVVLNTLPASDNLTSLVSLTKALGTFVQLGLPDFGVPAKFNPAPLIFGHINYTGSLIGSRQDIRDMLEFSAKHNIVPLCEEFDFEEFPKAYDTLMHGRPKFRCVVNATNVKIN
mgnify:CR=1 FL=1